MEHARKKPNTIKEFNKIEQGLDFLLSAECQKIRSYFSGVYSLYYQMYGKNEHGTELDPIYLNAALHSTYKPYYQDTIYNTAQNFMKNAYIDKEKKLYLVNHQGHKAKLTLDYIAFIRGVHYIEELLLKKIGDDSPEDFVETLNTNLDSQDHIRLLGLSLIEIYHAYQKELGLAGTYEHPTRHHKLFSILQKVKIPQKYKEFSEFRHNFSNVLAMMSFS